jgi:hypothetical protein
MNYEAALAYHRRLGNAGFVVMCAHFLVECIYYGATQSVVTTLTTLKFTWGLVGWACYVVLFVLTLWFIRRRVWELFYYTHHILFSSILAFGIVHTLAVDATSGHYSNALWWF